MKKLLILIFAICLTGLHAQEAIPASGGKATGSGGSVSYSVGQVGYTTNTGTNGSTAYGVQQPYEISTVTGIEAAYEIKLSYKVYPNPTKEYVLLNISNYNLDNIKYQLYDINGRLIQSNKIDSDITKIEMANQQSSIYFINVLDNKKEIKTFKIIKN